MTIDSIRHSLEDFLSVEAVGVLLHMSPDRLRQYAREGKLPFPWRESGNRILISRKGLLNWYDGKDQEEARQNDFHEALLKEIRAMNALLLGLLVHAAPEVADKFLNNQGGLQ